MRGMICRGEGGRAGGRGVTPTHNIGLPVFQEPPCWSFNKGSEWAVTGLCGISGWGSRGELIYSTVVCSILLFIRAMVVSTSCDR